MIIPRPLGLSRAPGRFVLPAALQLTAGPGTLRAAELLAGYLGPDRPRTVSGPGIRLALAPLPDLPGTRASRWAEAESYRLRIAPDGVELTAPHETGLLRGVQTLRLLLPAETARPAEAPPDAWWWPCLDLADAPALPWRGMMLDVARHFMPVRFLYEFVDRLALHKLNVLHLHLTDDQGWRIEIDGLPRLTEVGAWRAESMVGPAGSDRFDGTPHGGYYTARELRDLVAYADARGVRVVPEIEMPGHARAALAAYPELGARQGPALPVWSSWGVCEDILGVHDAALDFCCRVLEQTIDIFPDRYVHLGGDECPLGQWEAGAAARERAAALGLESPTRLHGWFLGQMHAFLAERGRRAVGWDGPGAGDLPAGMVLAAWLDAADAARSVERGHQVILAPHQSTFLDYPQRDHPDEPQGQPDGVTTLEDVYNYDPLATGNVGAAAGGRLPVVDPFDTGRAGSGSWEGLPAGVLGAQAQLWTEFAPTPAHVRYLVFPRLCAFAETAWSAGPCDFPGFQDRLAQHTRLLAQLGELEPVVATPGTMEA
ncbi:MAG TPA: beta-N-acetylhexosaminidase [Actinocrinis sp.]